VLFVEFMVFQGQSRPWILLYWSQLASDWQLIYCHLRKCREKMTWSTVAQSITTGKCGDTILFFFCLEGNVLKLLVNVILVNFKREWQNIKSKIRKCKTDKLQNKAM
jgi:hypothetical protein